jgi:hypothetical protein
MGIFHGGVPTIMDVENLIKQFGIPKTGTTISYDDLEACLGLERKSWRFKTVITAWRKRLIRAHNLVSEGVMNVGIEFLDDSRRVNHASRKYKGGLKKIERASCIAATTNQDQLTPEERRCCDHLQRIGAQIRLAEATAAKQLKLPPPTKAT